MAFVRLIQRETTLVDDDEFPLEFGEELSIVHYDFVACDDNRELLR